MMDCQECFDKLHDYLDRELTPEAISQIREHLDACAPCFDKFDFTVRLRSLVKRECSSEAVPEALRARILAEIGNSRVPATSPVRASAPRHLVFALAASLMVAFSLTTGLVVKTRQDMPLPVTAMVQDHIGCGEAASTGAPLSWEEVRQKLASGLSGPITLPNIPAGFLPVSAHVCMVNGIPMAHLVLRRDNHLYSCFISRTARLAPESFAASLTGDEGRRYAPVGENAVVMCIHSDQTCCFVSDQPMQDVKELADRSNF